MASISSLHCPKISPITRLAPTSHQPNDRQIFSFQLPNRKQFSLSRVRAQLNKVAVKKSSNSAVVVDDSKLKVEKLKVKDDPEEEKVIPDAAAISAFMQQASDLVKLVDSRDIMELHLKQLDCELIIRKKEALEQPAPVAPIYAMPPSMPNFAYPTPPPPALAAASPPPSAPVPALPAPPKAAQSSHPQLKCPMAGTFYRCPGPGEPPFVKVGDKIQKGQVICIIEAMKLMNEIEADQSGTVVEILVEDAKPVSVDTPLFAIAP